MTKKGWVVTVIALILLACVPFVLAADQITTVGSGIKLTMLNQDPDPVEPGQVVEVRFKLENQGKETREDVILEIMPRYPLEVYSGPTIVNIGRLQGAQSGADAIIADFKLKVDELAVEGEQELEVKYSTDRNTEVIFDENEFTIDIQTNDAILEISTASPKDDFRPGERYDVDITLTNKADSLLKDIRVQLNLSADTLPFAPRSTSAEQQIYLLQSEQPTTLTYDIEVKGEAKAGLYKVPVIISYLDERNNEYTQTDLISFKVGDKPNLLAYVQESDILTRGQRGRVTIELANAGITDIKFLKIELKESKEVRILSGREIYIGDIDSDDTESEEFEIFVNKGKGQEVLIPFEITYRDNNNKEYAESGEVTLHTLKSSELKKFGLKKSGKGKFIFFLILLGGGYYWYKKKYKQKKKK